MRRVVAPLIAASLLCAPFVAGAQSSRDLQVPTAALSILELPRDPGLPLAMSRVVSVLVDTAPSSRPGAPARDVEGHPCPAFAAARRCAAAADGESRSPVDGPRSPGHHTVERRAERRQPLDGEAETRA